jgi:hypothetical protein
MVRPFSERVTDEAWRREAETWIVERLGAHGLEVTGPIEQRRVRPWSTQLVAPTGAGRAWFKSGCAATVFEAGLHARLACLLPDAVDEPYAVDAARGWVLTRDRGRTLGDSHEPTLDDWQQVLTEAARMQRVLADHRDALLATGLPDCAPSTVVERFDRLVEHVAALPADHPAHATVELEARLLERRPAVVDAVALLEASPLPATWQHGDLHPWNVFATGDAGALRVFDFGDAQWAHAAELLSVPYGWVTARTTLAWPDVAAAFCAAWEIDPSALAPMMQAASLTQPVNRVLTWWGCLEEATPQEWAEWGEAPLHHLSRVLDP